MKTIQLNKEQIEKLSKMKFVNTDEGIIELEKDTIVLNRNGLVSTAENITIQFQEENIRHKHIVKSLQKLLCNHLNLDNQEVIFVEEYSPQEFIFKIKVEPNIEWYTVICHIQTAINTMQSLSDNPINIDFNSPYIGIYKRLNDPPYYFRWIRESEL